MQRRIFALSVSVCLVCIFVSSAAVAQYQVTNLVSNQVGWAKHPDPLSAPLPRFGTTTREVVCEQVGATAGD